MGEPEIKSGGNALQMLGAFVLGVLVAGAAGYLWFAPEFKKRGEESKAALEEGERLRGQLQRSEGQRMVQGVALDASIRSLETIAASAEKAQENSGFWTSYHLDNVKVYEACMKIAAAIKTMKAAAENPEDAATWGTGVLVVEFMQGSGALASGLELSDIIVAYAGLPVSSQEQLTANRDRFPAPGAPVEIVVIRGSKVLRISIPRGYMGVKVQ